jgi:hypothetical protein
MITGPAAVADEEDPAAALLIAALAVDELPIRSESRSFMARSGL